MPEPKMLVKLPAHPAWVPIGVWTTTAVSRWLATYAVLQGINLIVLDEERWAARVYETAMTVPGATVTWGLALLIPGLLALYGSLSRRMTLTAIGHSLCAAWSLFYAITLGLEALEHSGAATTGAVSHVGLAVAFCVLSAGAWQVRG